jgi:hypothetical protein
MAYFDEKLIDLHRKRAQKARLLAQQEELKKQEETVTQKVAELEVIKQKEQADVDKLEGKSIKALFFTLAGSFEEKLSKERQEAYTALMKYEAAQRDLSAIEADLCYCQEELEKLEGCEEEFKRLYEKKKDLLKNEGAKQAGNILCMEKDIASLGNELVEIEEALEAGYVAFELIEKILDELNEAHSMAEWDVFMESFLVDLEKYEHIKNAQGLIEELHNELRRFKTELADVQIEGDIQIEMDDFSKFADWFLDNIFTDWDVLEKIKNSLVQADNTKEEITNMINRLKDMRDARMKQRAELQERLENIVVEG